MAFLDLVNTIANNEEPAVLIPIGYAADELKERLRLGERLRVGEQSLGIGTTGMKKRKAMEEICKLHGKASIHTGQQGLAEGESYVKFVQPGIPDGSTLIFEVELLGIA